MSGLENFQPHLNMFGSNVFSSVESGARGSIDIQSVVRSIDGLVNLKTQQSQEGGIASRFQDRKASNDELAQLIRASGQTHDGASLNLNVNNTHHDNIHATNFSVFAGGPGLAADHGRNESPNKNQSTTKPQSTE